MNPYLSLKYTTQKRTGGVAQAVKHLPSKHEALSLLKKKKETHGNDGNFELNASVSGWWRRWNAEKLGQINSHN
jgi:hypothetical protein